MTEENKGLQIAESIKEEEEKVEKIEDVRILPPWVKELPNGNWEVTDKVGKKYELTDVEYDKIHRARIRAKGKEDVALVSESLVSPKLGEHDILKLKGSTVFRLIFAVNKIYEVDSFLPQ